MTHVANSHNRVYVACQACRLKKVKCDSALPKCSSCTKRGIDECIYTPRSKTRRRAKLSELIGLKTENTLLKKELVVNTTNVSVVADDMSAPFVNVPPNTSNVYEDLDIVEVPETVKKVFQQIKNYHDTFVHDDVDLTMALNQLSLLEFHVLLDNYWKYENVNVMVVWKRMLYSDILSAEGTTYSSMSLVLALLAVGSTFAYNKVLISKGYTFFHLAKKYVKEELWEPKLTTPQTMCLLCMFEHARGNRTDELYWAKRAINCALDLGLNRIDHNISSSEKSSTKDYETVGRFTWWGCYQIDMLVRTSVRSAPTVKKEITGVNPPQVSAIRYVMGLPEENEDSYFEFIFISTITFELCVIIGETLRLCYGHWPNVTNEGRRAAIEDCVAELDYFSKNTEEKFEFPSTQLLTFKLRFYYAKILLCGFFIDPQMLNPDEYELNSIRRCVYFAENLLACFEEFVERYGIWTLETFTSDFIAPGLTVILCGLKFDCHDSQREEKLLVMLIDSSSFCYLTQTEKDTLLIWRESKPH